MSAFGGKADTTIGTCPLMTQADMFDSLLVANFASTIDAF